MQEEYRNIGIKALSIALKQEKNISIFEKTIFALSEDEKEYKNIVYQVVRKIQKGENIKDILKNLKEGLVNWDSDFFDEFRKNQEEKDDFITNPFDVEEGVNECRECGSKKTFSYTKQMRKSDEGTTVFCICVICKTKWTISG